MYPPETCFPRAAGGAVGGARGTPFRRSCTSAPRTPPLLRGSSAPAQLATACPCPVRQGRGNMNHAYDTLYCLCKKRPIQVFGCNEKNTFVTSKNCCDFAWRPASGEAPPGRTHHSPERPGQCRESGQRTPGPAASSWPDRCSGWQEQTERTRAHHPLKACRRSNRNAVWSLLTHHF